MNKESTGREDIHISHQLSTIRGLNREATIGISETDSFYSYKHNRNNVYLRSVS